MEGRMTYAELFAWYSLALAEASRQKQIYFTRSR